MLMDLSNPDKKDVIDNNCQNILTAVPHLPKFPHNLLSLASGPNFNIKTIFPCMEISIIKIRLSWDYRLCNGNPYIGKIASLYWDGPPDAFT